MDRTYNDCSNELEGPEVSRGHVFCSTTDGVRVDKVDGAISVDLLDDTNIFDMLALDVVLLCVLRHDRGGLLVGHERSDEV